MGKYASFNTRTLIREKFRMFKISTTLEELMEFQGLLPRKPCINGSPPVGYTATLQNMF